MSETEDLEQLFKSRAQTRVVQYFLDHPNEALRVSKIMDETKLSNSQIRVVLDELLRMNMVSRVLVNDLMHVYTLVDSEDTDLLIEFLRMARPFLKGIRKEAGSE